MNQTEYKKQLIKLIQINKSNVFIDDESRREFMLSRFGVDSTKKLSIDQLKLLLDFCKRKVSDIPVARATEAQLYKLSKLWASKARDKRFTALHSFIKRITGQSLESVKALSKEDATKVIVALENMKGEE